MLQAQIKIVCLSQICPHRVLHINRLFYSIAGFVWSFCAVHLLAGLALGDTGRAATRSLPSYFLKLFAEMARGCPHTNLTRTALWSALPPTAEIARVGRG